jgi:hypothetical protein
MRAAKSKPFKTRGNQMKLRFMVIAGLMALAAVGAAGTALADGARLFAHRSPEPLT